MADLLEEGAGEDARARMKEGFFVATALIKELRGLATRRSELRRRSFHHFLSKGHIADERWQCLRGSAVISMNRCCFAE